MTGESVSSTGSARTLGSLSEKCGRAGRISLPGDVGLSGGRLQRERRHAPIRDDPPHCWRAHRSVHGHGVFTAVLALAEWRGGKGFFEALAALLVTLAVSALA